MLRRFLNSLYTLRKQTFDPTYVGRQRTCDSFTAFQFRMGAGFAGDVNRTHPASIEPVLIDAAAPPTEYGQPVLLDPVSGGIRGFGAADTADGAAYGFLVRPYPTQQTQGGLSATFGAATPPTSGVADVLRFGYIMVKLGGSVTVQPKKGQAVHVWTAASSGNHVQGSVEDVATPGSSAVVTNATFNGATDANGVTEVIVGLN